MDPERPDRIRIAVSTAGMYVTDDGGATWRPSNQGVRADFLPDKYPEFGQCVHKVAQATRRPDRMFLQNHWGLYRSDDRGESWTDIANGVPSDFGFGMAIHPEDPDCAWIVPLESDQFRCTPEGKLRVYRTRDAGARWEAMSSGLPQEGAYETVLRDALAVDAFPTPPGSTSARAAASCSDRRTKGRRGPRWPTACRRFSPSRRPWSDGRRLRAAGRAARARGQSRRGPPGRLARLRSRRRCRFCGRSVRRSAIA